MALPKKNGLRKIIVGSIKYYYTISWNYKDLDLIAIIGLVNKPNKRFTFKVKHVVWYELLGTSEQNLLKQEFNKLDFITPRHIRQAILKSNEYNWSEENYKNNLVIRYENENYLIDN